MANTDFDSLQHSRGSSKLRDKDETVIQMTELTNDRDSERLYNYNQESHTVKLPAEAWPKEPVPLSPDHTTSILLQLFDSFLVLLPTILVLKIALVVWAWKLDINNTDDRIDNVSQLTYFLVEFNGQMVTAFTIVFITIISTLVKRYALFKAEKGAYISELEQLQGSISLPSTFKLIWSLRAFTFTSLWLVLIWSFYYLGSQAATREFRLVDSDDFRHMPIAVPSNDIKTRFDPEQFNAAGPELISNDVRLWYQVENNLRSTRRNRGPYGTDSRGNTLIPNLNMLLKPEEYGKAVAYPPMSLDPHGWYDVSKQSDITISGPSGETGYTAFVGLPPWSSPAPGSISDIGLLGEYTWKTSFLEVGCGAPTLRSFDEFPNSTLSTTSVSMNMTQVSTEAPKDKQAMPLRGFEWWIRWLADPESLFPESGSAVMECKITKILVDLQVGCLTSGCFPKKMRYRDGTNQVDATSYSTLFDNDETAENLFSTMIAYADDTTLNVTTPQRTQSPFFRVNLISALYSGSSEDMSNELTALLMPWFNTYLNTYVLLSQWTSGISPSSGFFDGTDPSPNYVRADLNGAQWHPHYAIYWHWIALDAISCLILLAAAVVAWNLRLRTLAPDIFGYVSSLTRDNPHLDLPESGTTLNGIDRARMLREIKVKIGDISNNDRDVGKVGLARVDSSNVNVVELKPGTAYV